MGETSTFSPSGDHRPIPHDSSSSANDPRCPATSSVAPGSNAIQRNPANSAAGSSVRPSDFTATPGKPSRPGTPTRRPVLSYVHAWYGQLNRFAVPHPLTTCAWRCRQTLLNALTVPPDVLVSRIDLPIT